jgi:nucleotide-binding universal stress UspA family protein
MKKIVCGIDFSPASIAAARRAADLAGTGGTVRFVHVVDTDLVPTHAFIGRDLFESFIDSLVLDAYNGLRGLEIDLGIKTKVERLVVKGRPADEIARAGRDADMIVVGAHARDLLGRLALGSVAEEVARLAERPTLIVRETAEGAPRTERILVPFDVMEPVGDALAAADALARDLHAGLEVIHVISIPINLPAYHGGGAMAEAALDIEQRVREGAPRVVEEAALRAIGRKVPVKIAYGTPWKEIVREAKPTDIIVCGTHGRGALGRFAFGSVATKLAREAPCPVLVVRPRAAATVAPRAEQPATARSG